MRLLRAAAWTVFALDLVVLAQLLYTALAPAGDPAAQTLVRSLATMLGAGLAGIAVVLVLSAWLRNAAGFWVALVCGALPLLWVLGLLLQSMWE